MILKLANRLIEKETLDIIQIIDVLGERPYAYPENIISYIKEIRRGEKEKKEKEEKQAANAVDNNLKDDSSNNDTKSTLSVKDDTPDKVSMVERNIDVQPVRNFPNAGSLAQNVIDKVRYLISYTSYIIRLFNNKRDGKKEKYLKEEINKLL